MHDENNTPKPGRRSMPLPHEIARYWNERRTFLKLDWDYPACFACGNSWLHDCGGDAETTAEWDWNHSGLQRAHLVAAAQGGSNEVDNIVLLCRRCHREAPMIAISPLPMIEWMNRREEYWEWVCRRTLEEMQAVDPELLGKVVGLNGDIVQQVRAARNFLGAALHPGGDPFPTIAHCFKAAVEIERQIELVRERRARRSETPDATIDGG